MGDDITDYRNYLIELWCDGSGGSEVLDTVAWAGLITFTFESYVEAVWFVGDRAQRQTPAYAELKAIHSVLEPISTIYQLYNSRCKIILYSDHESTIKGLNKEAQRYKNIDVWNKIDGCLIRLPKVEFVHLKKPRQYTCGSLCHGIANELRKRSTLSLEDAVKGR
jgi:ribonuclease HI